MTLRRVYYLTDESGILSFYATKGEAQRSFDWWFADGVEPTLHVLEYQPTRVGIARLLDNFAEKSSEVP